MPQVQTVIIAVLAVAVAVLIAVMIGLIVALKKSKRASAASVPEVGPDPEPETESIGEYTIQLSDLCHPEQKWRLPLTGAITIGRSSDCSLVLTDARISRHQCRISIGKGGPVLTNLSETNETRLNGQKISESAPLSAGDILKLGKDELHVDFIQSPGEAAPDEDVPPVPPDGPDFTSENTRRFF